MCRSYSTTVKSVYSLGLAPPIVPGLVKQVAALEIQGRNKNIGFALTVDRFY